MEQLDLTLNNQWAIITGASSGIGKAICLSFARLGCNIGLHYHTSESEALGLKEQIERMGVQCRVARGDFTQRTEVCEVITQLATGLKIDILVNNAGSLIHRYKIEEMPWEHFDKVIALNLSSTFWAIKTALRYLRDGGRIINVTSIAALNGGGYGAVAYASAKGGIISMTRGLAKELAPRNIRVNALCPGVIDTPFHQRFSSPSDLQAVRERIPLKRLGSAEDCAKVAVFLATELSSYLTGEIIGIHGGQAYVW
jgi:3-oxoacyl-[acyl-carrier protein] reductase